MYEYTIIFTSFINLTCNFPDLKFTIERYQQLKQSDKKKKGKYGMVHSPKIKSSQHFIKVIPWNTTGFLYVCCLPCLCFMIEHAHFLIGEKIPSASSIWRHFSISMKFNKSIINNTSVISDSLYHKFSSNLFKINIFYFIIPDSLLWLVINNLIKQVADISLQYERIKKKYS